MSKRKMKPREKREIVKLEKKINVTERNYYEKRI